MTHAKELSSVLFPLCSKSAMDADKGLEASAAQSDDRGARDLIKGLINCAYIYFLLAPNNNYFSHLFFIPYTSPYLSYSSCAEITSHNHPISPPIAPPQATRRQASPQIIRVAAWLQTEGDRAITISQERNPPTPFRQAEQTSWLLVKSIATAARVITRSVRCGTRGYLYRSPFSPTSIPHTTSQTT